MINNKMIGENKMLLQSRELQKKYFSKTAVKDITLDIEEGRIYAILGPNGSGKTTFMKMAAGLVKPTSGSLCIKASPLELNQRKKWLICPQSHSFITI
jgi:ABC-2 type transport system ATP-binding protein